MKLPTQILHFEITCEILTQDTMGSQRLDRGQIAAISTIVAIVFLVFIICLVWLGLRQRRQRQNRQPATAADVHSWELTWQPASSAAPDFGPFDAISLWDIEVQKSLPTRSAVAHPPHHSSISAPYLPGEQQTYFHLPPTKEHLIEDKP